MKILAADLETASVKELHSFGPGYVRLCGWKEVGSKAPVTISTEPREMIDALMSADAISFHNGVNFDALALAKWNDADYEALCRKMFDTQIVERQLNPVAAKGAQPTGYYGLDQTAARYGVAGKSTVDFEGKREIIRRVKGDKVADKLKPGKTDSFSVLKLLKALYGGYHLIPQDDPDYVEYLRRDVLAQEGLFLAQFAEVQASPTADRKYIRREHAISAATGRITLQGFRTDEDETMQRWAAGQSRTDAGKQTLHEKYGMPLEGAAPHRTNPGKAAFRQALLDTGISEAALNANWPVGQDGSLLTGKDVLTPNVELFERANPAAAELCRIILAMNGERTVPGTILAHMVNGRVHPSISPDQSSGRWSVTDPGLTVLGKRGGKAKERSLLLADEGEVLVCLDADQVDARVIAAECQDPEYIKIFLDPNRDLHSEVALKVFRREECAAEMARNNGRCDCEWREKAKGCSHGWSYGMQPNGLAKQMGIPIEVAQQFDRGMTEAFPDLANWREETRRAAGALPYGVTAPVDDAYRILTNGFGRKVRVERARAFTQATAQIGQSGTRDIMGQALLGMPADMRRRVKVIVHDEFVLSLPKEGAQEAAQALADSMRFDFRGVPITFGTSLVGDCWGSCYGAQYCHHALAA